MTLGSIAMFASLSVAAHADARTVDVGQEVRVQLEAAGTHLEDAKVMPIRAPDGLEISAPQGPAMRRSISIINGRQTQSESLVWDVEVTPTRAGTFTIPSMVVSNGPETSSSQPISITAVGSFDPKRFAFVETRVDPRPRYVGEPITVTLVAGLAAEWVDRLVQGETALNAPWVNDGLGNGSAPDPEGWPDANTAGAIPVRTSNGAPVPMMPGHETRPDDKKAPVAWATWTLKRSFIPAQPGPVSIGPTSFRAVIATRVRRDAIFRDQVYADETKLAAVSAPPQAIVVKPLPDAGRPDDFSGLVGRLRLDVDANPRQVKVGETVRVKVRVSGDGNVATTPLPKVEVPGFKRFGAVDEVDVSGDVPVRTLTYDLAPSSVAVKEIPPFTISVFDTAAGQYRTLSSPAIPITVRPGAVVSALQDAPVASPTPEHREDAAPATPAPAPSAATESARGVKIPAALPWVLAAITPPILALAWVIARRRREPAAPPSRRATATRVFERALAAIPHDAANGAHAVGLAFAHFLADELERPAETFVGVPLADALAGAVEDATLRAECARLAEECDAAVFGGARVSPKELAARAHELAGRIHAALADADLAA